MVLNVAVCFGGEPRTYNFCSESIKSYFDTPDINVKFFAHTWNSNNYKYENGPRSRREYEEHSIEFIKDDIQKYYDFEKFEIEEKFETDIEWEHLFYSDAKSNLFKQIYEQQHNMTFDIVVKCRFDIAFDPTKKFIGRLVEPKVIYSNSFMMWHEYHLPNVDDVFYYGSSYAMDALQSNMYWINKDLYKNIHKYKYVNRELNKFIMKRSGPGVRIGLFANQTNYMLNHIPREYLIYRKILIPRNPIVDYEQMLKESREIY